MKRATLKDIMSWGPCTGHDEDRVRELMGGRESFCLDDILSTDLIPVQDRLWAVLRLYFFSESDLRMMCAAFAETSLKYFERERPGDYRPRDAIKASRLFALGEIDAASWDAASAAARAAAWDAARAASWDASRDADSAAARAADRAAARAAARDAARAAAWDAAWDAASAAARAADRAAQLEIVRIYAEAERGEE